MRCGALAIEHAAASERGYRFSPYGPSSRAKHGTMRGRITNGPMSQRTTVRLRARRTWWRRWSATRFDASVPSAALTSGRRDVRVGAEEVRRVVHALELAQSRVVGPERGADLLGPVVGGQMVDVRGALQVR